MKINSLADMDFFDKKVLVRTGFDVPIDEVGRILDDSRIRLSVPTIKKILAFGAKQVIIITHLGRPKKKEKKFRTDNVAEVLSGFLGERVKKINDFGQKGFPEPGKNRVVMLENLRFDPREKDDKPAKRDAFGKELAALADVYVNDAFSNCHRDHASMTSIPKFIPGCIGASVETEVKIIEKALEKPKRPFISLIGGAKADKLNAIANLIKKVDKLLVGGALGFALLQYFGRNIGEAKIDTEELEEFRGVLAELKNSRKLVLPVDAVFEEKEGKAGSSKRKRAPNKNLKALDIGPETIKIFKKEISCAKTIIWNGPMGMFELERFAKGTKEIAKAIAAANAVKIVGGGDSEAAVNKFKLSKKMSLVSSGGGASLQLFEGKKLVALEALKRKKGKNNEKQKTKDKF